MKAKKRLQHPVHGRNERRGDVWDMRDEVAGALHQQAQDRQKARASMDRRNVESARGLQDVPNASGWMTRVNGELGSLLTEEQLLQQVLALSQMEAEAAGLPINQFGASPSSPKSMAVTVDTVHDWPLISASSAGSSCSRRSSKLASGKGWSSSSTAAAPINEIAAVFEGPPVASESPSSDLEDLQFQFEMGALDPVAVPTPAVGATSITNQSDDAVSVRFGSTIPGRGTVGSLPASVSQRIAELEEAEEEADPTRDPTYGYGVRRHAAGHRTLTLRPRFSY